MCAKVAQNHETKEQKAKNPSKVLLSRIFYVPLPDKEPFLRPFGSKRAELERKQAGGSASSGLTIRISRQNTEIRRFPNCNLENCVISQTSDKQRWFEISSKVTKNRAQNKETCFFFCRDGVSSPSLMAKLRKKSVTKDGFWKINANCFLETVARAKNRPL